MTRKSGPTIQSLLPKTILSAAAGILGAIIGLESLHQWQSARGSFQDLIGAALGAVFVVVAVLNSAKFLRRVWQVWAARYHTQIARLSNRSADAKRMPPHTFWLTLLLEEVALVVGLGGLIFLTAIDNGEERVAVLQVVVTAAATMQLLPVGQWIYRFRHRLWGLVLAWPGVAATVFWATVAAGITMDQLNFRNAAPPELAVVVVALSAGAGVIVALVLAGQIWLADRRAGGPGGQLPGDRSAASDQPADESQGV